MLSGSPGMQIWPPIMNIQISLVVGRDNNFKVFKIFEFTILQLGTLRVLSRVENLASNYDCSNTFRFFWKSFQNFQKILIYKTWNIWKPIFELRHCQGTLLYCKSCQQTSMLKCSLFPSYDFLNNVFKNFQKNWYTKFYRKRSSQPWSWDLSGKS